MDVAFRDGQAVNPNASWFGRGREADGDEGTDGHDEDDDADLAEQAPDGLGIDESAHGAQQAVDAVDRREDQLLDPLAEGERRFDPPVGARDREPSASVAY